MDQQGDRRLLVAGGLCGLVSVVLYILPAIIGPTEYYGFPAKAPQAMTIAYFWALALMGPLGIVNSYALYRLLAWERQGAANRLGFLFSVAAFGIVTEMVMIQDVVRLVISEHWLAASASQRELWEVVYRGLDGIDLGLDLAWDMFLGISMLVTAPLMVRHSRLGPWWGIPSALLGMLLLGLNGSTVPKPPASSGLFDVGPIVGLYGAALSVYMVRLGLGKGRAVVASA